MTRAEKGAVLLPDFRVHGANLYYGLELAPWESMLGTAGGEVEHRFPNWARGSPFRANPALPLFKGG